MTAPTIHAGNTPTTPGPGQCRWHYEFGGVYLRCGSKALLLGELCAHHLIEFAAAQPESYWSSR